MEKTIGFIGCGNMGKAIIGGLVKSAVVPPQKIIVSDINQISLNAIADEYEVETTTDNIKVAKKADIVVLAVKPNIYEIAISKIKDVIKENTIVVSIAAGKSIASIERAFAKEIKIVRTMPNTPVLVGEGMTCICKNDLVTDDEIKEIVKMFSSFGQTEVVGEDLMDVVTATSGSSPAYVFMFIEAMADAAVLEGLPREKAYRIAAQAVLGAAKMVLATGKHPAELKDMVCSPGGTTIEAVASLEEDGMRSAIINAMQECVAKAKKMS